MTSLFAVPGETIPLTVTLEDGDASQFPQARVYNEAGTQVGSSVNLTHVFGGTYLTTFTVPSSPAGGQKYTANITVYSDAGHTIVSTTYGRTELLINADAAFLVRDVSLSAPAVVAGSLGEGILGALNAKVAYRLDVLTRDANGFATTARLRIFPSQALAAASTPGATGEGEIITVPLTGTPDGTFVTLPTTVVGG